MISGRYQPDARRPRLAHLLLFLPLVALPTHLDPVLLPPRPARRPARPGPTPGPKALRPGRAGPADSPAGIARLLGAAGGGGNDGGGNDDGGGGGRRRW